MADRVGRQYTQKAFSSSNWPCFLLQASLPRFLLPLSTDLARHFNLPARSSVLRDGFMEIRVRLAIMMAQLFGVCQALFQEQQASCRGPAARPNKGYWRHKAAVVA